MSWRRQGTKGDLGRWGRRADVAREPRGAVVVAAATVARYQLFGPAPLARAGVALLLLDPESRLVTS